MSITVHPRERGEHLGSPARENLNRGSSPRARGTPDRPYHSPHPQRFIPASAGNTSIRHHRNKENSVHPRERGEHPTRCLAQHILHGSSPRARGTLQSRNTHGPGNRFIPASAGNTAGCTYGQQRRTVHPRERGEHSIPSIPGIRPTGSSPRARGTLTVRPWSRSPVRFIPASAGNTQRSILPNLKPSVHPRERGEHNPRASFVVI